MVRSRVGWRQGAPCAGQSPGVRVGPVETEGRLPGHEPQGGCPGISMRPEERGDILEAGPEGKVWGQETLPTLGPRLSGLGHTAFSGRLPVQRVVTRGPSLSGQGPVPGCGTRPQASSHLCCPAQAVLSPGQGWLPALWPVPRPAPCSGQEALCHPGGAHRQSLLAVKSR